MLRVIEVDRSVRKLVRENGGYCPCMIEKTPDTKCICKAFKQQDYPGLCHCGRFEKVEEEE